MQDHLTSYLNSLTYSLTLILFTFFFLQLLTIMWMFAVLKEMRSKETFLALTWIYKKKENRATHVFP